METSDKPSETPTTANPSLPTHPAPAPNSQNTPPVLDKALGVVDLLSDAEKVELHECEAVVVTGWNTFVEVGLALARIRQGRLCRDDFDSFDAYCRAKWQYTRVYVNQLISAAQLFTHLAAICVHRKPDHESQVRPLIGLTLEQSQLAWECAVALAGEGRITARVVKTAMQQLQLVGDPKGVKLEPGPNKAKQRRLVDDAIGQLLMLLSQKVGHAILTEKVEILHRHIQALFASGAKR